MIKYINGDLFDNILDEPTIIAHVCNDKGGWGRGFVVPLAQRFPITREEYMRWSKTSTFERGNVQFVPVPADHKLVVANMVAQTLGGERPVYYNALAKCMDKVREWAASANCTKIICPMFGAGLAGGDWNFIEKLIEDCWLRAGLEVTVCYLPQFLPKNWSPPADTPNDD